MTNIGRGLFVCAFLLSGCSDPPLSSFSLVEIGAFTPTSQRVVIELRAEGGGTPDLSGSRVTVDICERNPALTPGCVTASCRGELSLTGVPLEGGIATVDVPLTGDCRRAGPGLAGDVVVTVRLPNDNGLGSYARLGPPELQGEPVAPTPVIDTPPTPPTVAPAAAQPVSGTVVAPHPIVLAGIEATLGEDPADPDAVVVHAASCDVHVAAPSMAMTGATSQSMLSGIGATFTTSDVAAADHWALAYAIGGRFSIQHGLVVDGHTYVCRGTYADAAAQACGAAICGTMRATGGAAAASPSGPIVAHCILGAACNQAREPDRDALAMSCGIVSAPIAEGACPATVSGGARLGLCVTSSHTEWVYYAIGGQTLEAATTQCTQLGGSLTP